VVSPVDIETEGRGIDLSQTAGVRDAERESCGDVRDHHARGLSEDEVAADDRGKRGAQQSLHDAPSIRSRRYAVLGRRVAARRSGESGVAKTGGAALRRL